MVGYKEPKVLIAVPTAEFARRADFYDHLEILDKSACPVIVTKIHGQSPARNRNIAIQQALEHDCSHILFFDDDVIMPPDTLSRLLAHDVDMVTGLYLMRNYPHQPIVFDHQNEDGLVRWAQLKPDFTGLREIVSSGLGCCLIRTAVFKAVEQPWVRLGEIESDHWCDDIGFFKRARAAGFKLFVDTDVQCGHIQSVVLRPIYHEGKWYTQYDTNGTGIVTVPAFYQE